MQELTMPPEDKSIRNILEHSDHRPWPLPNRPWRFYQEWHDSIFVHWKVPLTILLKLIPKGMIPDLFNEEAWVSLVIFTMRNMRPRFLPPLAAVSDFHEVNVRTYINMDNRPGIYFLSIEASKLISAMLANSISGIPYEYAQVNRHADSHTIGFSSRNKKKNRDLELAVDITEGSLEKSELDKWLTERYCLYTHRRNNICMFQIHHPEWPIQAMRLRHLRMNYQFGELNLLNMPVAHANFSPGVKVVNWWRETVR